MQLRYSCEVTLYEPSLAGLWDVIAWGEPQSAPLSTSIDPATPESHQDQRIERHVAMALEPLKLQSLDEYLCRTCRRLVEQARNPVLFPSVVSLLSNQGLIHNDVGQDERCNLCPLLCDMVGLRLGRPKQLVLKAFAHAGSCLMSILGFYEPEVEVRR